MKIDKSLQDEYAVLTLRGEFDTFNVPGLQGEAESLLDRGVHHIVLNMRLVKFINSTALGCIIKIQKLCKAENGDLVIAHPSSFVRDITSKLGIDRVIQVFDDEDLAVKHVIQSLNALEFATDAPLDQERVLISFPDETRNQQVGGQKVLLGSMRSVDATRAVFSWSPTRAGLSGDQGAQLFFKDSEIRLKFQVKYARKGYFNATARVEGCDVGDEDLRITARFEGLPDGERTALQQFAEDMELLKRQLPRS